MNKTYLPKLVLHIVLIPMMLSVPVLAHNSKGSDTKSNFVIEVKESYGSHLSPMLDSIGASPDQRQKITEIVMSHKPKIEPLRQEYKEKSQEFLTCIMSGRSSEVVMYEQDELNRLHGQIACEYGLMHLEIRRVLTPGQWKLFQDYENTQGWHSTASK